MSVKIPHTLYLCYFGLREPLVQTQVLPYLREIKKDGIKISLLTFEAEPEKNWTQNQITEMREHLAAEGISWEFLKYHKRPSAPATLYDVFCGAIYAWRKVRKEKIDILHGRVHIPTMMAVLAKKFSFGKKPKVLFDIRGFMPEEYTDAGLWEENGRLYKAVKKVEKWLLKESDGFVVLTEKAREILFPESVENDRDKLNRPVEVIPCCVDLSRFDSEKSDTISIRQKLNIENRFVAAYVGSFGGWYLTDAMADFFRASKQKNPNSFAMILTQSDPKMISTLLEKHGLTEKDFFISKVSPAEIPQYLVAADVAISFIKPCYSKLSSSPTKIAEYLIGGVPIISSRGVGDVAELIERNKVGAVLNSFDEADYLRALDEVESLRQSGDIREKCRNVARNEFDLEQVSGNRYRRIYKKILQ